MSHDISNEVFDDPPPLQYISKQKEKNKKRKTKPVQLAEARYRTF